ncbi:MAG TPA: 2-keto-4-methylthiobutyrate aminotransferase, partial [Alphaproteobacteria bacterium]|nr:2-keto-4-methylthiobutyrate aminotransferase [Alphaproteobacteria bacterium]
GGGMIGWLNGELAELDTLRIDPRDRGFLLGDGLFETLLSENGTIRRVRRHLTRLQESADLIG